MKKIKVYKAREGSRLSDKDAAIYGKRLESLTKTKGHTTPKDIINDAKNKKAPYHNYFCWDNTQAGKLYRLQQARQLVESIVIDVIIEGESKPQRALVSVTIEKTNKKGYVPLEVGIETTSYRKELLRKIQTTLKNGSEFISLLLSYEK